MVTTKPDFGSITIHATNGAQVEIKINIVKDQNGEYQKIIDDINRSLIRRNINHEEEAA